MIQFKMPKTVMKTVLVDCVLALAVVKIRNAISPTQAWIFMNSLMTKQTSTAKFSTQNTIWPYMNVSNINFGSSRKYIHVVFWKVAIALHWFKYFSSSLEVSTWTSRWRGHNVKFSVIQSLVCWQNQCQEVLYLLTIYTCITKFSHLVDNICF